MNRSTTGVPTWLAMVALLGAASALLGGYWDDAWHTDRGRDTFFIAPHIAIYLGIATVGAALSLRVLLVARAHGVRVVLADGPLLLAAVAVLATLASGPIDELWHRAFGRDAVIWSPPHMLGIVGTLALGAALLAGLRERPRLQGLAGGLVVAAATFPVAEYETDVPQFDELFYLPVLGLGVAIALALVTATTPRPWARTSATLVHGAFLALVSAVLVLLEFPAPSIAVVLAPALTMDLLDRRGAGPVARAVGAAVVLHAVAWPIRNLLGDGVELDLADVAVGLPLTVVAMGAVAFAAERRVRLASDARLGFAVVLVALLLLGPEPAEVQAHDPGQGVPVAAVELRASTTRGTVSLDGRLQACDDLRSGTLVARRAGEERRAPLRLDGCSFGGAVDVEGRGRWFVYAELVDGSGALEAWLPIDNEPRTTTTAAETREAYRPTPDETTAPQVVGGGLLYGAMVILLIATFRLVRRPDPTP